MAIEFVNNEVVVKCDYCPQTFVIEPHLKPKELYLPTQDEIDAAVTRAGFFELTFSVSDENDVAMVEENIICRNCVFALAHKQSTIATKIYELLRKSLAGWFGNIKD